MAAEAPQEQPGNAADGPEEQSLLARLAELLKLTDPSPDQVAAITILVGELVGEPAEIVSPFVPKIKRFVFRCAALLRTPAASKLRSDWAFLGKALGSDFEPLWKSGQERHVAAAAKSAPETTQSKGKFMAALRNSGATDLEYHTYIARTAVMRDRLPAPHAQQIAQGNWYNEKELAAPTSIINEIMLADTTTPASHKLEIAWQTFVDALTILAKPEDAQFTHEIHRQGTVELINPLRAAGVSQKDIAELIAAEVVTQIRHHLELPAGESADDDGNDLMAIAHQLGDENAIVGAKPSPWSTLIDSLDYTTVCERRLKLHNQTTARIGVVERMEADFDPMDHFLGFIGHSYASPGWRARLKSYNNCPMWTLAPGMCPARGACKMRHPTGDSHQTAWKQLNSEFQPALLEASRQMILHAAAQLTALGVSFMHGQVQPTGPPKAKPPRSQQRGNKGPGASGGSSNSQGAKPKGGASTAPNGSTEPPPTASK